MNGSSSSPPPQCPNGCCTYKCCWGMLILVDKGCESGYNCPEAILVNCTSGEEFLYHCQPNLGYDPRCTPRAILAALAPDLYIELI